MSFWQSDLGEITGKPDDAFTKSYKQIPDNTLALAKIESFVNVSFNGIDYLNIEWLLTDGEFKNQKVSQKLKVFDYDTKAKHRALNMFKLLYQLFNLKPAHANAPTDIDLGVFVGKTAGIRIRETEPNANGKQYNWVSEVHSAVSFKCETGTPLLVNNPKTNVESAFSRNAQVEADDIPF